MSTRQETITNSRRSVKRAIRLLLVTAGIAGASAGSVWYLSAPSGPARSRVVVPRPSVLRAHKAGLETDPARSARPQIPLFSEDWTDDSGQGLALRFSRPITDPRSLEQVRTSDEGRGQRGIDRTRAELAAIDRRIPAGRAEAMQACVFLGLLHMSVGEFTEADRSFDEAQAIDPDCPELLRANIQALRGVAALRRGESENCVACCVGSSCIFPLDHEAIHSRPSGSREAIRHFSRYLERRPEDLGIRWLLNVAHMTLGEYPDAVPSRPFDPIGAISVRWRRRPAGKRRGAGRPGRPRSQHVGRDHC